MAGTHLCSTLHNTIGGITLQLASANQNCTQQSHTTQLQLTQHCQLQPGLKAFAACYNARCCCTIAKSRKTCKNVASSIDKNTRWATCRSSLKAVMAASLHNPASSAPVNRLHAAAMACMQSSTPLVPRPSQTHLVLPSFSIRTCASNSMLQHELTYYAG